MPFKQVFTADDKELAAAYEKQKKLNEELLLKIRQVANEAKKADREQAESARKKWEAERDALKAKMTAEKDAAKESANAARAAEKAADEEERRQDRLISTIGKTAGAYASVQTVLKGITLELERKHQLEADAAKAQVGMAGGEQSFLHNLGFVSAEDRRKYKREVESIIKDQRIDPNVAYAAAGDTMSAAGNATPMAALRGLREAATVSANMPDQIRDISQGIVDTANMTGQVGENDMKKNLGLMMSIGATARVTSLQGISQNVIPGMNGVRGFGDSPAEAAAIVSTLSSRTVDRTGAISKTASIALAKQLADFLPEKDTGLKSTMQRIEYMQANPKLADKFMNDTKGVSFEKEAFIPIRDLLTGGSDAAKKLASNRETILAPEAGVKALDEWTRGMNEVDSQRIAGLQRHAKMLSDQSLRADPKAAARGVMRNEGRQAIADSGESGIVQWFNDAADSMTGRSPTDRLRNRIYWMQHSKLTGLPRTDLSAEETEKLRGLTGLLVSAEAEMRGREVAPPVPPLNPPVAPGREIDQRESSRTSPANGSAGARDRQPAVDMAETNRLLRSSNEELKKLNTRTAQPAVGAHSEQ
jgi:PAS domain-containing protein